MNGSRPTACAALAAARAWGASPGGNVFHEAEGAAGAQDATDLGQDLGGVGHRAEHERGDHNNWLVLHCRFDTRGGCHGQNSRGQGQPNGFYGQEVAGEDTGGLDAEELRPGGSAGARCRPEMVAAQDGADRGGGDLHTELAALADDPDVAQRGFSRANRSTNSTTCESRPRRRRPWVGYVQRRRTSSRCHRRSVDGVTRKIGQRSRGSSLANVARTMRSSGVYRGRVTCRRSTAS
jgi:hypothetical protein